MGSSVAKITLGPSSRGLIVGLTQPLAALAFFCGAWLAHGQFPGEYDWRYMVVSALHSPRDNPLGYPWFAAGIGLSGLLLLPLTQFLHRALRPMAPRGAIAARSLLWCGIAAMLLVAVFTHRPLLYPRLHENLALLSYASLVLGLLVTAVGFARAPEATRLAAWRHGPLLLKLLPVLVVGPLAAAGLLPFLLYLTVGDLGWVDLSWRERGVPPYLSFAFWQWILSVLLYADAWLLAWLARND